MHFRKMYPSEYLGSWDLKGDTRVTIAGVAIEEVAGSDGKKQQKPVVSFEKAQKRMVLCKTNARAIAKQHGNDTDSWVGKVITVYPTQCMAFGQEVECVRVR